MGSSTGIKRIAGLLAGALLAVLSGGTLGDVTEGSKAAGLESCVAPTPDIRRNHMAYLKHDRVETVQRGVRDIRFSLSGCVDCHAGKDASGSYLPVDGEVQFCQGCHNFVAVGLACFQCHRKTPQTGASQLQSSGSLPVGVLPAHLDAQLDSKEMPALSAGQSRRLHAIGVED